MDFLLEALSELQETVFFAVANLLNLEVDLSFFDTTSTYFDIDHIPEELAADEDGAHREVSWLPPRRAWSAGDFRLPTGCSDSAP
jgi:hypothetical protein